MARAAVRSAASTDPDIEVEAEATPTAPARKSRVLKMGRRATDDVLIEDKGKAVKAVKAAKAEKAEKDKPEKADKPKKAPKPPADPKFIGVTTGMRVAAFQNQLMARNFKARLTDEQLAKAMRDEFPRAIAFTPVHVKGIRSQWNHGKHNNTAPEKPLPEYGEDRNPIVRGKGGAPVAKKVKAAK